MERIEHKDRKYKTVSIFSGIGGFDLAFLNAGFDVIWANDFDKFCIQTYKENVSENIVYGDINDLMEDIPKHDVLVGGFPCQPFSIAGKLSGFQDKDRGLLFFSVLKIIEKHRPKAVILENVRHLLHHDNGKTYGVMRGLLEGLGYQVYCQVLDTKDYGIPQSRKRAIIVCFRKDIVKTADCFHYPEGVPLKKTLQDMLDEDVPQNVFVTRKGYEYIMSSGTKGYVVRPEIDRTIARTLLASMTKNHRASIDNYVTDEKNYEKCDKDKYTSLRRLTPNECRKLQGFPSDWKQVVSNTQAYKQFGNAVTVDVLYAVAKAVYDYLEENCE